jgi:hypothetical protein
MIIYPIIEEKIASDTPNLKLTTSWNELRGKTSLPFSDNLILLKQLENNWAQIISNIPDPQNSLILRCPYKILNSIGNLNAVEEIVRLYSSNELSFEYASLPFCGVSGTQLELFTPHYAQKRLLECDQSYVAEEIGLSYDMLFRLLIGNSFTFSRFFREIAKHEQTTTEPIEIFFSNILDQTKYQTVFESNRLKKFKRLLFVEMSLPFISRTLKEIVSIRLPNSEVESICSKSLNNSYDYSNTALILSIQSSDVDRVEELLDKITLCNAPIFIANYSTGNLFRTTKLLWKLRYFIVRSSTY